MKSGRTAGLSATTAQKIASYLGVSVGYLLGEEELCTEAKKEKPTTQMDDGLSDDMKELINCIKALPEDKIQMLLQVARSIR